MPETVYKRKKDRALKILDDAYFVAKELVYLQDYWREGAVDNLILNKQKYLSFEMNSTKEKNSLASKQSNKTSKKWPF